jgi:Ca2+-binding RTX toxin-like protein
MIVTYYIFYLILYIGLSCFISAIFLPTLNVHAVNIIMGTSNTTVGTSEDDVILGCSFLTLIQSMQIVQVPSMVPSEQLVPVTITDCTQGDLLIGLEGNDVLQGSSADDSIHGDEGNDQLTGADGNDKLFGENGADVLQGGFGGDFLFGGAGNDELYSGPGDDILFGSKGADYFDCAEGYDTVIDFTPINGDTHSNSCEVVLTHSSKNIDFICDAHPNTVTFESKLVDKTTVKESVTSSSSSSGTSSITSGPNSLNILCNNENINRFAQHNKN